jgi:hypothetical protein
MEGIDLGPRLAMPNPAYEGIARQIKMALQKVGGTALADAVYETKSKHRANTLHNSTRNSSLISQFLTDYVKTTPPVAPAGVFLLLYASLWPKNVNFAPESS